MAQKPVTNSKGEEIVFRRVRGRIVPIKKKRGSSVGRAPRRKKGFSKRERAEKAAVGSALFGSAILAGAFGGSVFSEFGGEAKRSREVSKGFMKRAGHIKAQETWLKQKIRIAAKKGKAAGGVFSERTGIGSDDPAFLRRQRKTFTRAGARARMRARNLSKVGFKIGAGSLAIGGLAAAAGGRQLVEGYTGRESTVGEEAFTDVGSAVVFGAAANEFGLKQKKSFRAAKTALKKILSRGRL